MHFTESHPLGLLMHFLPSRSHLLILQDSFWYVFFPLLLLSDSQTKGIIFWYGLVYEL